MTKLNVLYLFKFSASGELFKKKRFQLRFKKITIYFGVFSYALHHLNTLSLLMHVTPVFLTINTNLLQSELDRVFSTFLDIHHKCH